MRFTLLPLALAAACGGGPYADAADRTVAAMNELQEIFAGVKDKSSAEAAKTKMEALSKRLDEILADLKELGPPKDEDAKKAEEKMSAGMQALGDKMDANMQRFDSMPDVGPILDGPFAEIASKFQALRGQLGG